MASRMDTRVIAGIRVLFVQLGFAWNPEASEAQPVTPFREPLYEIGILLQELKFPNQLNCIVFLVRTY